MRTLLGFCLTMLCILLALLVALPHARLLLPDWLQ